jgi:hypothetical protein
MKRRLLLILGLPMMLAAFVMSASPALAQRGLDGSVTRC